MRAAVLALASALAVTVAPAAIAKPKPPITRSYTATAPVPDPTNAAPTSSYTVCPQVVPQSFSIETFKAPAAGKLAVKVTGIIGDWDLLIMNDKKSEVGSSGSGGYGTPVATSTEASTVKIKKAGTYYIVACNWAGAPTANVSYTFTYA